MTGDTALLLGITLIFIGFILLIISLFSFGDKPERKVEGGGVIFIGPVPVVFGSSPKITTVLLVLAIILVSLLIILYILPLIPTR